MNQQEKKEFEDLKRDFEKLKNLFYIGDFPDKKVYYKKLVADGGLDLLSDSIVIGKSTGTIGLFGGPAVVRQGAITSPSGGGASSTDAIDISARTAIGQIKTALQNIRLTS